MQINGIFGRNMNSPTKDNGTPKMKQKSIQDFFKHATDSDITHIGSEYSQQKNLNLKRKNSVPNDSTVKKRKIDVNYNF